MKKSFTAKLWKVMKVCAVQAMIAVTLWGVVLSHPNYGQLLDREITIFFEDVPFENALKELERAGGIHFAYSIDQLEGEPNVSLSIQHGTLRAALDSLLTARGIRYKVHEKDRLITLRKIPFETMERASGSRNEGNGERASRYLIDITGTVTDAAGGTPMAGVNVLVKGTTTGTTTDADGQYRVGAEANDLLVFSFIGFETVEIPVNGRSVIDVVMTPDVLSLGEVVVNAGYWEVTERERTGNISRVTAREIRDQPVNNPLQALQGRMPGVYIEQQTGVPGGALSIEIRGRNSLRPEANQPLYIIDGVPFPSNSLNSTSISSPILGGNPLIALNPLDIQSIEILKDADATAIYGSRGANGVVLITTKKGKGTNTSLDVSFNTGFAQVAQEMDLLGTEQYIEMRKEAFMNDGFWPLPASLAFLAPDLTVFDTTAHTDWQKELIGGTARTTNAQISLYGGNEQTRFLFSTGYYREGTVFPGDAAFRRISGSLNVNHTSENRRFNASVTVNYSSSRNNLYPADLTREALMLPPNMPPLRDSLGGINWNWSNPFFSNPLANLERVYRSNTQNIVTNAALSYELVNGLDLKLTTGHNTMNVSELSTNPLSAQPPPHETRTGSSTWGNGEVNTWIVEPQAHYSREIGRGKLVALVGTSFQESREEGSTLRATGYASDALLENVLAATEVDVIRAHYSQYRYGAVFGRVNYNWGDKYILNITGRRDGSSRFGPGKRFGNFGAMGAAWIFSEESFVRDKLPFLSFGKLRTSLGITGSDAIGDYQYLNTYSSTTYPYNGSSGLILTRLANPEYSWETNRKFEVGLDLGLFKDRIAFSASWFDNRATDQLVGLPLPVITGQSSVQFNLPATVQNKGWEFQFSSDNLNLSDFSWTTDFNLTLPQNVLLEFPDLEDFPAYNRLYQVGLSVFTRNRLKMTGVDPETGLYTFEDTNGDGSFSATNDRIFEKEVAKDLFGGLRNTLSYKGFSLAFFLQFVVQTGSNYIASFGTPGSMSNQPTAVLDRWRAPGDVSGIQRYSFLGSGSTTYAYYKASHEAISDASFLRLKNVSISWDLPQSWLRRGGISMCRIYVLGQNLFTDTSYLGLDPETQSDVSLPPLRTINFGFQFNVK